MQLWKWKKKQPPAAQAGPAPDLNAIIQENIRAILEHRREAARRMTVADRFANLITDVSGRMGFAALHVVWFGGWILLNSGLLGAAPFDPFPYGLLTMIVSLEAIFLSTFVLISQNRMSEQEHARAELDLQINLLTERELTRVLQMLDEIQHRLGIDNDHDQEMHALQAQTRPVEILKEIEREELAENDKNPVV